MREIKFRGKRIDNGEWVYGTLVVSKNTYYIVTTNAKVRWMDWNYCEIFGIYRVIPKSVGQFIGQKDKNGKEIYVGDIVRWINNFGDENIGWVRYTEVVAGFYVVLISGSNQPFYIGQDRNFGWSELEVIGSIHENPELLEAKP